MEKHASIHMPQTGDAFKVTLSLLVMYLSSFYFEERYRI